MSTTLNIVENEESKLLGPDGDGLANDGTGINAKGGTEMVRNGILERCDPELLKDFKFIHSRVRDRFFEEGKNHILVCHDLWNDPENEHLKDPELRKRFDKIVFVSDYQAEAFQMAYRIPPSEIQVIRNGFDPIERKEKDYEQIRLIYHTTPHRGLELLVPVFTRLYEELGNKIHLDVFSNFEIYGWEHRNEPYKQIFEACKAHPGITYHGTQPNSVVREYLQRAHIFAYPSIWSETSCLAAIEAMSARCVILCPRLGALPETTADLACIYPMHEDVQVHIHRFANVLIRLLNQEVLTGCVDALNHAKNWTDNVHSWEKIAAEWNNLMRTITYEKAQKNQQVTAVAT